MDPWKGLASLARRQHGVVSVEQAAALGICTRTLERRVDSAAWDRPHRGTYGLPGAMRTYRYAVSAAVLAAGPGALAAGRTAAHLWDLTDTRAWPIELVVPAERGWPRLDKVRTRRTTTLVASDYRVRDGIAVTAPARTVPDMAAGAGAEELGDVLARAQQRGLALPADVLGRAAGMGPHKGAGRLRAAVNEVMAHGRTDSMLERRVRRLLARAGLAPHPGLWPVMIDGRLVAELDLAYPEAQVVVEIDGYCWHSLPSRMRADHVRENWLKAWGWLPLRIGDREFRQDPERFLLQLRMVLDQRR